MYTNCLQVLFANQVVNHHGKFAQGGHYTCDVLSGDQWLRFDDADVSTVDAETVTGLQKDRQAYMLFYVKQQ
jgi:ubiquitin carboxyl-terminal hydrolase 10